MQAISERPGGKQRGFTLVEMMIAMLMMTVDCWRWHSSCRSPFV